MAKVNFVNEGIVLDVEIGSNLRQLAIENDISIYSNERAARNCKGQGKCGTCQVEVLPGSSVGPKTEAEEMKFQILKPGEFVRLACQTTVEGDCEVKTIRVEM